jgi:DNA-binding CsgD family transcriptional regulator
MSGNFQRTSEGDRSDSWLHSVDYLEIAVGVVRNGRIYGRVTRPRPPSEPCLVEVPETIVAERGDAESIGSVDRVGLRMDGNLISEVRPADWRQYAVNLHVRTPLARREADVYVLHNWFGLGRKGIASELGISPNTVDNHLQKVRGIDEEMTDLVLNTIEALNLTEQVREEISTRG